MSANQPQTLTGKSGKKYKFLVYALGTEFKPVGAVYAITKRVPNRAGGSHTVIYIGQTADLSERFDDHHKATCFTRNGANCIGVHQEASEARRLAIEKDLIDAYDPPCNGT